MERRRADDRQGRRGARTRRSLRLPRISHRDSGLGQPRSCPRPTTTATSGRTRPRAVLSAAPSPRWSWDSQARRAGRRRELFQQTSRRLPHATITLRPSVPVVTTTRSQFPYAAIPAKRRLPDGLCRTDRHVDTFSAPRRHLGVDYTRESGDFSPHYITDETNVLGSNAMMAGIAADPRASPRWRPEPDGDVRARHADRLRVPEDRRLVAGDQHRWCDVQDEWQASSAVRLVPGLRVDAHSEFGSVLSPKLGATLAVNERTHLRASAGRAYRAPSLSELYGTIIFHGPIPGIPTRHWRPEFIRHSTPGCRAGSAGRRGSRAASSTTT